ncbi:hypothetical protein M0802_015872 [Mischocyttarus mexicanus]|nr:hypothetical protein M0802_015872 [Mischocyttarus mexicanus]
MAYVYIGNVNLTRSPPTRSFSEFIETSHTLRCRLVLSTSPYNNNQNVTSTDGMANLRELAHEIEEINKICNKSEMLIAVKKLKSTPQQCTSKSQQFQAFIEFSNGLDS